MAIFKCTADLRQITGIITTSSIVRNRIGGWSESWYFNGTLSQAEIQFLGLESSWCAFRARLLPKFGSITGQRIQQVDPPGPSSPYNQFFASGTELTTDNPQVALLVAYPTVDRLNTRNWAIRDLPQARQIAGEYSPSAQFTQALDVFNDFIRSNFVIRAVNHSFVKRPVVSVDGAGLVTTKGNHALAPGDEVSLSRLRNTVTTRNFSAIKTVLLAPLLTTFTTVEGFGGVLYTKGSARKYEIIYPTLGLPRVERTVTKKIGRPSEEYRGRVSARR